MIARYAVTLSSGNPGHPLFCLHPASGEVSLMRWLFRAADLDRSVVGLRAFGLDGECEPLTEIPTMAARFVEIIRQIQPIGPYRLFGYCFGGEVAHEIAAQLVGGGEEVAFLGLLGLTSASAQLLAQGPEAIRANRLEVMAQVCRAAGIEIGDARRECPSLLKEILAGWKELGRLAEHATVADLEAILRVSTENIFAVDRYERPKISVRADVFLSPDQCTADTEADLDARYSSHRVHPVNGAYDAWLHSSRLASLVHDVIEIRSW